jgi:excisionase family DNA binding protein
MERFVTAEELSRVLNVPITWVWSRARQGKIPFLRVGKYMRFDQAEVIEFLKSDPDGSKDVPMAS